MSNTVPIRSLEHAGYVAGLFANATRRVRGARTLAESRLWHRIWEWRRVRVRAVPENMRKLVGLP